MKWLLSGVIEYIYKVMHTHMSKCVRLLMEYNYVAITIECNFRV